MSRITAIVATLGAVVGAARIVARAIRHARAAETVAPNLERETDPREAGETVAREETRVRATPAVAPRDVAVPDLAPYVTPARVPSGPSVRAGEARDDTRPERDAAPRDARGDRADDAGEDSARGRVRGARLIRPVRGAARVSPTAVAAEAQRRAAMLVRLDQDRTVRHRTD